MTTKILSIISIVLLVSTIFFAWKYYRIKSTSPAKGTGVVKVDSLDSPIFKYRDTGGVEHSVYPTSKAIDEEATKRAIELSPVIQDVAKNMGVPTKNIQGYTTISTQLFKDSIKFLSKQLIDAQTTASVYKDKYLSLTVRNYTDSSKMDEFDLKYNADLNITEYKKGNIFTGKKSYTDISSNDPRVTIMGMKKYTIPPSSPSFVLRGGVGVRYDSRDSSFSPGIFLATDIKSIHIQGNYMYNSREKKPGFSISLSKDLFQIK